MPVPESPLLREIPGGARRADTFLLVVVTLIAVFVVPEFRTEHPPVLPLLVVSAWLQILAQWLRHVRPQYCRALEYLGALALGAALYAAYSPH